MDSNDMQYQSRIRVLEVIGNGIVGGMESVVLRLIERLPRDRFDVVALCPYEGDLTERLRSLGVDCLAVPMPDDPRWAAIQTVSALVYSMEIDVLHAHLSNAHTLAAIVGCLTDRPVIATVHGRQMSMVDLELHRLAGTHLSTVCRHTELHALGSGADPDRVNCIPNGVDTGQFAPREGGQVPGVGVNSTANHAMAGGLAAESSARVSRGGAGSVVIGFVGRLSHEKGPDVFVRVAGQLRDRVPNARFVLFGDGPMRPALRDLIDKDRLSDRVTLAGVRHDMPAAYAGLDMLVSTSYSEAMPLAIMEAMSSGLPVVATRVGGVPDLVEHGATGWLCDPGNVEQLAEFVLQLCLHAEDRIRYGSKGRQRMIARFDIERSISATAQLFSRVVAGHSGNLSTARGPDQIARSAHTQESSPGQLIVRARSPRGEPRKLA